MLNLPLKLRSRISGDAGLGPSAPAILTTPAGVVVSRKGRLALNSLDLEKEEWARSFLGRPSRPVGGVTSIWYSILPGQIHESSLATGEDIRRIEYSRTGVLRAISQGVCLVELSRKFEAIDWEGRVLWSRDGTPGHVVSRGDQLILSEDFERRLVCIDTKTGAEVWHFEAPPQGAGDEARRSQVIAAGFPSVRVVGSRVVVITIDLRVFVLSVDSGKVLGLGRPPFLGCYEVTESSIFFKQPFGLSEFDHRSLTEVDRVEYETEVAPLYRGRQPTVNAFCLTDESVVWTTMHGALMGVSRKLDPHGRRVTWCDEIPGALMPLAEAPVPYGGYLYYCKKGDNPELLCFGSR